VIVRSEAKDGGVRMEVSLSPQALGQFEQLFPAADIRNT
jgi:GTP-binding protein HflX